jgi:hypothetical protein
LEERKTAKDAEVDAGLALEAVLIGHCGIAILVHYVLGRADINDVDSIGMGIMMKKALSLALLRKILAVLWTSRHLTSHIPFIS